MAKKSHLVSIGKRKIDLTNLDKVIYPEDHILKAEIIEYYLKIAPTLLRHVKGRALSFIRYPDGIYEESFFQKNKPDWAPDWIDSVKLGKEKKDYILAGEEAALVWTANLAAIEIHQAQSRQPHHDKPDYFVVDLDPPDDFPFEQIKEMAIQFREHLDSYGYVPFIKTTGRKSFHIVVPVNQTYSYDQIAKVCDEIGKAFVKKYPKTATLSITKNKRTDKVLIDVFRNRASQTIISPYSLRALPKAPVSMPITWEQLENIKAISDYNIKNALQLVLDEGDPWESIGAFATDLHTHRKKVFTQQQSDSLEKYQRKRTFKGSPEPQAEFVAGEGNAFVVHRHHATRLHYDLRLEQNGVLKSWAVPKGLPPFPGVKRLAVHTEDHPLKYLDFFGSIPKGEYGGGEMWIYARGKYQIIKEKKNGFYFRLQSKELNGEYRIHDTGNNQWLLERVDNPQIDWLHYKTEPMLAESAKEVPKGENYIYEVKWDGIRALIALNDGSLRIMSRNQKDITHYYPELNIPEEAFRVSTALFDAEIVCLDNAGRPVFKDVVKRLHHSSESMIERSSKKYPAVCYLFDCLYLDGRSLINEPLYRRKEWLADSIKSETPYRISEAVDDGKALFEAAKKMDLEGIVAKDTHSLYQPGKRTQNWLKIKVRHTMEAVIIGYTKGKGDRQKLFGALHIAENNSGKLNYLGKVGTGFDTNTMKEILTELDKLKPVKRPIDEKPPDDKITTWLEAVLFCEVQFASITSHGTLREPVFVRLRPDL